ncbi:MAG TPA: OmpA family protein [Thermoanaerobaculia bacterium]|nr:OmpA family protein [Thermoanaerobaculia bacterium]
MWNALLASLVIVLVVLAPACRTTKKDIRTTQTDTTVSQTPPPEVAVRTDTATTVAPPDDFVRNEPTVTEEVVPSNIEELNRWARDKGFVRDAFFNYDESTLDADAQSALSSSATWLRSDQGASYGLLIQGHCDERGTEQYNLALGDRRANVAKDYLVTLGIDSSRIRTVSYGEERPFEEGHDDAAMAQNRRAHLVLVR